MDPFTLGALGLSAVTNLAGAIQNEATRKKRKKKAKNEAYANARYNIQRDWAQQMGMPTYDLDAKVQKRQIDRAADEQYAFDPMSFVPFAKSGAGLAQTIYNGTQEPNPNVDPDGFEYDADALKKAQEEDERKARLARYAAGNPWAPWA